MGAQAGIGGYLSPSSLWLFLRSRSSGFKNSLMDAFCGGGQQTHDSRVAGRINLAPSSLAGTCRGGGYGCPSPCPFPSEGPKCPFEWSFKFSMLCKITHEQLNINMWIDDSRIKMSKSNNIEVKFVLCSLVYLSALLPLGDVIGYQRDLSQFACLQDALVVLRDNAKIQEAMTTTCLQTPLHQVLFRMMRYVISNKLKCSAGFQMCRGNWLGWPFVRL